MLKRTLILLVLALSQWGCDVDYGENLYPLELWNLEEVRYRLAREKREFLKIDDLQVGNGAIASWGTSAGSRDRGSVCRRWNHHLYRSHCHLLRIRRTPA
jgi:hypothetical protein